MSTYSVRLASSTSAIPVSVSYGGAHPQPGSLRRTMFTEDGHVLLVALDMPGLPREMISHMDACRFFHMLSVRDFVVSTFLSEGENHVVKNTCFLMAMHFKTH